MKTITPHAEPVHASEYRKNRNQVPLDVLLLHAGQFVAWSLDGMRILASATDLPGLFRATADAGLLPGQFVQDYIDDANLSQLL